MELLPNEAKAKAFVLRIGFERSTRLINAIDRRFQRRYKKACINSFSPINPEWIYKTKLEVELMHQLKMGLSLADTSNTPAAARQRILERIERRKAK
ncbi:hypothetical protein A1QO_02695 [Vibrio genomosp. F10 str. ZF-129]|uniref:Uncharacterized protein n=1 Tax=Vibrio genomosp. F10 str. ZF-129 TaxID=1187848 RepID=A0A1E5BKE3_9VIBR|nr:hypothetical protein [Vibrio genomosp. F10]OEE38306.1 hypothetical protein A1QO_02695 [Vibrio genomosp. F10 str. ZF-129]